MEMNRAHKPTFPTSISMIKPSSLNWVLRDAGPIVVSSGENKLKFSNVGQWRKNVHAGRELGILYLNFQEISLHFASYCCYHHADLAGGCCPRWISKSHTVHLKQKEKEVRDIKWGEEWGFYKNAYKEVLTLLLWEGTKFVCKLSNS